MARWIWDNPLAVARVAADINRNSNPLKLDNPSRLWFQFIWNYFLAEITFYQIDQIQIQILQILSASISPWVSSSFVLTLIITLMIIIIIMSINVTLIVTLTITLNNQGQGKSQLDNSPNNVELSPISLSQFSPLTPGRYLSTSCILGMCMGPPCLPATTSTLIKWRPSQTKRQGRPVHLLPDPSQPACLTAPICPWQLPYCPTRPTLHPPSLGEFKILNIWGSITTTFGCLPKNPNDFIFLRWCGPHSLPSTCPSSTSLKPLLVSLS